MVQEVKKQFGEEAKVSVVVDKANQNVYDGEGGLMFGYNEETHAFVMDENYDVSNQIDLVTEVVSRILPDFDLQAITNFFSISGRETSLSDLRIFSTSLTNLKQGSKSLSFLCPANQRMVSQGIT